MERNFKLTIEYDGTGYSGWQRQKDQPTVQGAIEAALATLTGASIPLKGSGRTDAGVHALSQVANFHATTRLGTKELQKGLNALTPEDIVITSCETVPLDFHARFDAREKTYQYRIGNRPIPAAIGRQYAWFIRRPLDVEAMKEALAHFQGIRDFKAFESTGSPRAHTIRNLSRAVLGREPCGILTVTLTANGFLRGMVRNIVGTLVEVGVGRLVPDAIPGILGTRNRNNAGAAAPPHGLFLVSVAYSEPPAD